MGGAQHAAEPVEKHGDPVAPPPQGGRALVALGRRGRTHLSVEVGEQRSAAVAGPGEDRKRGVEPAAIEVRVQVAEARRQAAAHLAVGRRMGAARQPPSAVAQAEERVELLHQLHR